MLLVLNVLNIAIHVVGKHGFQYLLVKTQIYLHGMIAVRMVLHLRAYAEKDRYITLDSPGVAQSALTQAPESPMSSSRDGLHGEQFSVDPQTLTGTDTEPIAAGIVAGKTFGVAKRANIVAVKVLADSGSGSTSQVISGINWIIQANYLERAAVCGINCSRRECKYGSRQRCSLFGSTPGSTLLSPLVGPATTPESSSPGRVPQVITVGATTVADARAPSSNYGLGIDIYAPGTNILSAWYTSDTVAAYEGYGYAVWDFNGCCSRRRSCRVPNRAGGEHTPAAMSDKIKDYGLPNVLSGIPSEGINYLAHNAPH
ncbi:subtilisin-like protein [Coprinellus micaceus]|uniref:Subtilisin-like protein n=1 Tax=Coprinellus micaceus TaxID=71717 RepID=A0A4Y7SFT0_COPMI|nr:subtilisin-like protein [Coprinellus micaceus]